MYTMCDYKLRNFLLIFQRSLQYLVLHPITDLKRILACVIFGPPAHRDDRGSTIFFV